MHTETAVRHLFSGIDEYMRILRAAPPPVLAASYSSEADHKAALDDWFARKGPDIAKSIEAERAFIAQKYALATLCGSVLQIAFMAIRLYSQNTQLPPNLTWLSGITGSVLPFCIGRLIHGVPLGLIVYAGRNQYNHADADQLSPLNTSIFDRLCSDDAHPGQKDPAFDLGAKLTWNYPSNITKLVGWRSYDSYATDMEDLLIAQA